MRVFPLTAGSKKPVAGSRAHLDAVPWDGKPIEGNYGIALNNQFVLVDFDSEDVDGWKSRLPETLRQRSRRGQHFIYRRPAWSRDLRLHNGKFRGGDVKVNGYVVGPGSIASGHRYEIENPGAPIEEAPRWVIEHLITSNQAPAESADTIDVFTTGVIDDTLASLAGWGRNKGLSEEGLYELLSGANEHVVSPPASESDLRRIARSYGHYEAGSGEVGGLAPGSLRCGSDVGRFPERQADLLPGFVPEAALTIVYGDGKIGKSSFASWVAAKVTRDGKSVVFIPSGEEPFDLFVRRARLNGCEDSLLFEYQVEDFRLPESVPALQEAVGGLGDVGLVYIDALYSHFGPSSGENEAVRARSRLKPLAEFAAESGIAIVGTVHENAQGNLLGSREMRNVSRSLLHAKGGKGKDFTVWSAGSNGWSPDYGLVFKGTEHPVCDENGEVLEFEDIFGDKVRQAIWVLELTGKAGAEEKEVDVDQIEEHPRDLIAVLLREFPKMTYKQVAKQLSVSESVARKYMEQLKSGANVSQR